jgi:hypothetical protein
MNPLFRGSVGRFWRRLGVAVRTLRRCVTLTARLIPDRRDFTGQR